MDSYKLKSSIISKKNETINSLVNGTFEDAADFRYLQGIVHGIDHVLSIIKQMEFELEGEND